MTWFTLNNNLPARHYYLSSVDGRCAAIILALWLGSAFHASADTVGDFYRQKTINFITVYSPGGTYDLYSRLVATHLPRFIPGIRKSSFNTCRVQVASPEQFISRRKPLRMARKSACWPGKSRSIRSCRFQAPRLMRKSFNGLAVSLVMLE